MIQDQWIPAATGANFDLPRELAPLAPVRDHINVLSGLSHLQADTFGDGTGDHPRSSAVWLTGVHAYDRTRPGVEVRLATTADQIAGAKSAKARQIPSLELTVDFPTQAACDSGDCFYVNTVSWRNETTPNLAETHPRIVFERLFGDGGSAAQRMSRHEGHRQHSRFGRRRSELPRQDPRPRRPHQADRIPGLGPRNRAAHPEHRVARHADRSSCPSVPWTFRRSFDEHTKLMFDLVALAFQADITRVFTMMFCPRAQLADVPAYRRARRASRRLTSPERCRPDLEEGRIDTYHVQLLTYFLEKLQGHAATATARCWTTAWSCTAAAWATAICTGIPICRACLPESSAASSRRAST